MRVRWTLLIALLGCFAVGCGDDKTAAKPKADKPPAAKPEAEPPPKPAPAAAAWMTMPEPFESPVPCTAPQPQDKVCPCLSENNAYAGECAWLDDGAVAGVRIARVGNGQGTMVYAVLEGAEGWFVAAELEYEQGHGKASGKVTLEKVSEETRGSVRLARIDYGFAFEAHTPPDSFEKVSTKVAYYCALSGAEGTPRCSYRATLACSFEAGSGESDKVERSGSSSATVTLADTGVATFAAGEQKDPGESCKVEPGAHRVW